MSKRPTSRVASPETEPADGTATGSAPADAATPAVPSAARPPAPKRTRPSRAASSAAKSTSTASKATSAPAADSAARPAPEAKSAAAADGEVQRLRTRVRELEAELSELKASHRASVVELYDSVDDRGRRLSLEHRRAERLSTQMWVVGAVAVVVGLIVGRRR